MAIRLLAHLQPGPRLGDDLGEVGLLDSGGTKVGIGEGRLPSSGATFFQTGYRRLRHFHQVVAQAAAILADHAAMHKRGPRFKAGLLALRCAKAPNITHSKMFIFISCYF
jgi:hypothetical protein